MMQFSKSEVAAMDKAKPAYMACVLKKRGWVDDSFKSREGELLAYRFCKESFSCVTFPLAGSVIRASSIVMTFAQAEGISTFEAIKELTGAYPWSAQPTDKTLVECSGLLLEVGC